MTGFFSGVVTAKGDVFGLRHPEYNSDVVYNFIIARNIGFVKTFLFDFLIESANPRKNKPSLSWQAYITEATGGKRSVDPEIVKLVRVIGS